MTNTIGRKAILILLAALGAVGALFTPLVPAAPAEAWHTDTNAGCLYADINYGGGMLCVSTFTPWPYESSADTKSDLRHYGWNDVASAKTISLKGYPYKGRWVASSDIEFYGYWFADGNMWGPNDWYLPDLRVYGWNDIISAIGVFQYNDQ